MSLFNDFLGLLGYRWTAVFTSLLICFLYTRARRCPSPFAHVPGPPSSSSLTGNLLQLNDKYTATEFHRHVASFGTISKVYGLFNAEELYVTDPRALQDIIRNPDTFEETRYISTLNTLALGPGLVATVGSQHKRQRKMLDPLFMTGHLRELTPIFYEISHQLRDIINSQLDAHTRSEKGKTEPFQVDILGWLSRTALEIIGQAGLGHSFHALESEEDEYGKAAKSYIPAIGGVMAFIPMLPKLSTIGSASFRRVLVNLVPLPSVQHMRDIINTMDRVTSRVFEKKKQEVARSNTSQADHANEEVLLKREAIGLDADIMTKLLKANTDAKPEDRLPEEELRAQMSTLLFGAYETSSSAISRILHQLCLNPTIQAKLRAEILAAREQYGGDLDYETLDHLPYLDAVVRETLRMCGPVTSLPRTAVKDVILPLSRPIPQHSNSTSKSHTGSSPPSLLEQNQPALFVPRGTTLHVGISETNTRTEIWGPDARLWRPERWLLSEEEQERTGERIRTIPEGATGEKLPGVYSNMMSFLGGPRGCIGFKFALLEMKIVLSVLIDSFTFELPIGMDLEWTFAISMAPAVVGIDKIQMPLKIGRVEKGAK